MHAVVTHVTIDPNRIDEAEKLLNSTVMPRATSAKGFVSGVWTHDADGNGVGVAVFETEDDANALVSATQASPPPDGAPTTIDSVEVYTVAGTA
jgi:hypothetical protein